ncbi:MAG TPA: hypothetical protein VIQ03_15725 [Gammaproteobacteria bacterium]
MNIKIADATLHINENLEKWQRNVLADHMRMQTGVIAIGYHDEKPHLMTIGFNLDCTNPMNFIHMIERHGYHAKRIG